MFAFCSCFAFKSDRKKIQEYLAFVEEGDFDGASNMFCEFSQSEARSVAVRLSETLNEYSEIDINENLYISEKGEYTTSYELKVYCDTIERTCLYLMVSAFNFPEKNCQLSSIRMFKLDFNRQPVLASPPNGMND